MNTRHLAALLGFAFVAAWIALNFGYALLCLIGAATFYAAAAVLQNDVDLGALQARVTQRPPDSGPAAGPSATRRTRVQ